MGQKHQSRRATRLDTTAPPRPTAARAGGPDRVEGRSTEVGRQEQARSLLITGARAVGDPTALEDAIGDLVMFGGTAAAGDALLASRVATGLMTEELDQLYAHGWQPADVVHVVRRDRGVRVARLAAAVVMEHGLSQRAPARAPLEWVAQLESMGSRRLADVPATPGWNVVGHIGSGLPLWESWSDVLTLIAQWLAVVPMERLLPVPSSWPARRAVASSPRSGGHDPKKLVTIRALLAKAEASGFAEEAETFTAKAQDLMTRYAIDEVLLADPGDGLEIRSRRVHVDNPYAATKAQLLAAVGRVNHVRAIWNDQFGTATVVGLPVDLDLSEMLFTSLLVQATKSMTEASSVARGGHRPDRAPSFRRAFLLAYAQRIGERLSEAEHTAQSQESATRGADLLPVLARRTAAVEREFERLFPITTQSRATQVDARGWNAGRAAADRAVLARGQVDR
ncbi:Protein of unknown function [Nakamurella panacisegetis]|uniref:Uncharacterized protein n=1 Tax=Nakamurella panacisegetis TaxID=1090615 RepID=A0A1H0J6B2_9ACTN|nr:DUF2786 domain-containing protein [Nakamurella panacisegetis]SDO39265.1 Protein of unknown function [Nakamurella panacisegetis]